VLLLDEPTSGLDPEITRDVRELLAERRDAGCAMLVSTHNLDVAERLADRVAVLQERLLAVGPPATLRQQLTTGRVSVRVAGDPARFLDTARHFDPHATLNGPALSVGLGQPIERTPELVAALVAAGAQIIDVRQETPPLEDVYFHLVANDDAN